MRQYQVKRNVIEACQLPEGDWNDFMAWSAKNLFCNWMQVQHGIELPWLVGGNRIIASTGSWIVKRGEEFEWWKDEDFHKEFKEIET